ncbi:TorF family putative porin [Polynucleobacter sp. AP-Sanab-80-C2]|uniref:TorF family putative porin n=1 Tax=Polynucleobacter sp. AP-Sanab-80-C2 TaxID=3108274 RepID=UPI002B22B48C|nr:TorF family putative porin [Polynucleobacter sp. AP-Sanab-80-C2]MEA9600032.1 TorF family putative porin [Polynucleobacter sp. AP-Sanab-80-C2]
MKTLHKTAISAVAAGLLSGLAYTPAFAADEPEASPITANVTVVNDYRYRGISQSNFKPAIQGGFDYAHESGFYIGNWNSSISWISDSYGQNGGVSGKGSTYGNVSAPVEMDFYAGYKKELIGEGFASDLGVLQYYYPTTGIPNTAGLMTNPNTTEIYAAQNFTFGPVTGFAKFSYAVTTLFGTANSTGSYYPDLTVNYDTGFWGLALNGHVGYQYVAGNQTKGTTAFPAVNWAGNASTANMSNSTLSTYTDWKFGVTKDFGGGLSAAAAYVGTNASMYKGSYVYSSPSGNNLGRAGAVVSLTKTF